MPILDLILRLICLLLWVSWRMACASPGQVPWHRTLLRTLRRAAPKSRTHWAYPLLILLLVLLRGFAFHHLGDALGWVPRIDLGLVSIPFRSDRLDRMLLFSGVSIAQWLGGFYLWLLLLSVLGREVPEANSFRHFIQINLGWLDRLPSAVKLLLPLVVVGLAAASLVEWWGRIGLMPAPSSAGHALQQGLALALASLLTWKFPLVGVLLLYLVESYVYLGHSAFWEFIEGAGRRLLRPLRLVPLRVGRMDFAPVLLLTVVLFVAEQGGHWLEHLYRRLPW